MVSKKEKKSTTIIELILLFARQSLSLNITNARVLLEFSANPEAYLNEISISTAFFDFSFFTQLLVAVIYNIYFKYLNKYLFDQQ